jgi:hypothetical protein
MTRVSAVSGIPTPWDKRAERAGAPPPPGSLKDLAVEFANLQEAVDGADAEPSPDALAAYASLQNALNMQLKVFQQQKQESAAEFAEAK